MLNVEIQYNPFLVNTVVSIDGKTLTEEDSNFSLYRHRRLQDWIDVFLAKLPEQYRDRKLNIIFKGTAGDADDVKEAAEKLGQSDDRVTVTVDASACRDITPEHKIKELKNLFEEAKAGPFESIRSDGVERRFMAALDPSFEVNVIATMSSGKSTVVNAMLGTELMPAKNEACTATIARIEDHDDLDEFLARRFGHDEAKIDDWLPADAETLARWNDDEVTSVIEVKGDIPSIDERENVRITFIDTPGPNNSRDLSHGQTTDRAITSKPLSMVLYVLNATQLGTNDDDMLLKRVAQAMKEGGRQAHDRFIFIANKIDEFDPEKGESVELAIGRVKRHLRDKGIESPIVVPTSAELAKLLRVKRNYGEKALSRSDRGNLKTYVELFVEEESMNMVEHVRKDISPTVVRRLHKRLTQADTDDKKAEILSGVPIVEEMFDLFLRKHAIPSKIADAVENFRRIMREAAELKAYKEQFEKGQEELEQAVSVLKNFQKDKQRVEKAREFRESVKGQSYEETEDDQNRITGIMMEADKLLEDFRPNFATDIETEKATKKIGEAQKAFEQFIARTHSELDSALKKSMEHKLNNLRDKYQKFAQTVLEKQFPKNAQASIKQLQAITMEMPSTRELIENSTQTKTEEASRPHKGFFGTILNLFGIREKYLKNFEVVQMADVWEKLENRLRAALTKSVENYRSQNQKQFNRARQILLNAMDKIDAKMKSLTANLKRVANDENRKKKELEDIGSKITWHEEFDQKLQSLLHI